MKLLLKKDVPKLGIVGDVVNVSAGFARNYLLPQSLATEPTEANMRSLADERAKAEERRRLRIEKMQTTADRLADVEITIEAAANPDGVLYGSVGPREVAVALREEGHEIDAEHVHMPHPIKHLDNAVVEVLLAEDIKTSVKVWVVRSKASELEEGIEGTEADSVDDNADEE